MSTWHPSPHQLRHCFRFYLCINQLRHLVCGSLRALVPAQLPGRAATKFPRSHPARAASWRTASSLSTLRTQTHAAERGCGAESACNGVFVYISCVLIDGHHSTGRVRARAQSRRSICGWRCRRRRRPTPSRRQVEKIALLPNQIIKEKQRGWECRCAIIFIKTFCQLLLPWV